MKTKLNLKLTISIIILIAVALLSFFLLSKVASSPDTYKSTIKYLDDKKMTVVGITGASAAASVALSTVPGDSTTAIANQIMQMSSYLLVVVATITLEKFLLTIAGYISFKILVPLACLFLGIYLFVNKKSLKLLSIKILAFALVLVLIVPLSVQISKLLDDTHALSVEQNAVEMKELEEDASLLKKIGNATSGMLKKAESVLSGFVDSIAVLLITCCIIPILVFVLLIQALKLLFHINITIPDVKKLKHKNKITEESEELQTIE